MGDFTHFFAIKTEIFNFSCFGKVTKRVWNRRKHQKPCQSPSVLAALATVQQKLRQYTIVPDNGLAIFAGLLSSDDGRDKKIIIEYEPFKPFQKENYWCGERFLTEELCDLVESEQGSKYGFIILDGSEALFGKLAGNHRTYFTVFLFRFPKSTVVVGNLQNVLLVYV